MCGSIQGGPAIAAAGTITSATMTSATMTSATMTLSHTPLAACSAQTIATRSATPL